MKYMFDDEIIKYCTKCDEPADSCNCDGSDEKNVNTFKTLAYGVGDDEMDYHIFFDYFVRKDGKVEIEAVVDGGNFTDGLDYKVVEKENAVDIAQEMVDRSIDILMDNEITEFDDSEVKEFMNDLKSDVVK